MSALAILLTVAAGLASGLVGTILTLRHERTTARRHRALPAIDGFAVPASGCFNAEADAVEERTSTPDDIRAPFDAAPLVADARKVADPARLWFPALCFTGPSEQGWVPIVVRSGLDEGEAGPILSAIAAVERGRLRHAYGSADHVLPQLAAITVGDQVTREKAWWNVWGNIHHQGTIYAATRAVPIIVRLADWVSYPDHAEAILFLREGQKPRVLSSGTTTRTGR